MRQVSQQIPPEIQQLAATYQLGAPQYVHTVPQESFPYRLIGLVCLCIGTLIIFAYLFLFASVYNLWPQWQAVIIPLIGIAWVCTGGWITLGPLFSPPLRVFMCPAGLIYVGHKAEIIPWNQVEAVWKKVRFDTTGQAVCAYIVQRRDKETFVFKNDLHEINKLGAEIEQQVTDYLLPKAVSAYAAGTSIDFDTLVLNSRGIKIKDGFGSLLWEDIEHININEAAIRIYKKNEDESWATLSVGDIPNVDVFKGLVDYIMRGPS